MKEQTIRLIDLTINHLEQMEIAGSRISFESLKGFVQCQVWTKKPEYQDTRYVDAIAWIAWHTNNQKRRKTFVEAANDPLSRISHLCEQGKICKRTFSTRTHERVVMVEKHGGIVFHEKGKMSAFYFVPLNME